MTAITTWPGRAESWLDDRGKGAWIAATVLAFIIFWPAGIALLAYLIWGKRMFGQGCSKSRRDADQTGWGRCASRRQHFRSSGNSAFDAYKADTLERLSREQDEFESFLKRLRDAKDKSEFDQYMDQRARAARESGQGGSDGTDETPAPGSY
jgi:hypothetical protein